MIENPVQPETTRHRRRPWVPVVGVLTAVGVATGAVAGTAAALSPASTVAAARTIDPATGYGSGPSTSGTAASPPFSIGPGTFGYGSGAGSTGAAAGTATADQVVGVVDITTRLGYADGAAAGTGMVLTPDGTILTNNHVVEGATSITVTVLSTGGTYDADVVGTAPARDVAVLQLEGASGLATVKLDPDGVAVGEAVTAVGNAGGDPTSTSAAEGTVTALDQTITATDGTGGNAEQLTGLIQTDADVQAGDSGGPLFDADGEVVGMDTAASSGGAQVSYAIPIDAASDVAAQILAGVDDGQVHQGYPAFLGVSVRNGSSGGAAVAGVVTGGPAATAGLTAGDVITSIGSAAVTSGSDVPTLLAGYDPGDDVVVTWIDGSGATGSATVTLATGPAD